MKIIVFLTSAFISFNVFSETYVCSHELSRYGRQGEIETLKFERVGNVFTSSGSPYQIGYESESFLTLISLEIGPSLSVILIDKNTKEWGMSFLTMYELKNHPPSPNAYGSCVIVN